MIKSILLAVAVVGAIVGCNSPGASSSTAPIVTSPPSSPEESTAPGSSPEASPEMSPSESPAAS